MSPEYSIKGNFPGTNKRFLRSTPDTCAVLITEQLLTEEESNWIGTLIVNTPKIKGKIIFERNSKDKLFSTEQELVNYLSATYSVSYLKDRTKPAIMSGG